MQVVILSTFHIRNDSLEESLSEHLTGSEVIRILSPHSRSEKAVEAFLQWRGEIVGVESAEAFVLGRKLI